MIEADDDAGSAGLRRSVTRAEADLTRAVLAALPQRPHIHLFLACDGSDESIERCRPTLASLAAQIDPRWTLHPVARRAAGERDRIAHTAVLHTLVGGKVVYEKR